MKARSFLGLPVAYAAALIIGITTALGIWLLKHAIKIAEWLAVGWVAPNWGEVGQSWVLIVPVIGGLIVGWILHLGNVPDEPKSSFTELLEDVVHDKQTFPAELTRARVPAAIVSLGSGAALGPTDAAGGIGATVAAFVSRRFSMSEDERRLLLIVGATAGISAAFKAPIAAVIFAIEVFRVKPVSRDAVLAMIASASAFLLTRFIYVREEPDIAAYPLLGLQDLLLCVGLGVLAAIASIAMIRGTHTIKDGFTNLAVSRWLKPAIGGVALMLVGLVSTRALGVGYATLEGIASGSIADLSQVAGLAGAKALLMAVSFASGLAGGFFAPALFTGAALGSAYAHSVDSVFGSLQIVPHNFALPGMAAVLAATASAPLAATMLLVEMTNGLAVLPAALITSMTAVVVARLAEKDSIYTYSITRDQAAANPARQDRPFP